MIYLSFRKLYKLFVALALALSFSQACYAQTVWQAHDESNPATVNHQAWQEILDEYLIIDDVSLISLVDYQSLAKQALPALSKYLKAMADIDIRQYNRREQFAYWVNLYNAITVHLVAENYPVSSIKDISESILPLGPWNDVAITLVGHKLTLNDIEHKILRPLWKDHRIHFAVNCASKGCPNLRSQVFTGDNTEELLKQSAIEYLQHPRGLEIVDGVVKLSSIFDWYQTDFGENQGEMLVTLIQYLSAEQKDRLKSFKGKVVYRYDWSINNATPTQRDEFLAKQRIQNNQSVLLD